MVSVFYSRNLDSLFGIYFICSHVRQTSLEELLLVGHTRFKLLRNVQVPTVNVEVFKVAQGYKEDPEEAFAVSSLCSPAWCS